MIMMLRVLTFGVWDPLAGGIQFGCHGHCRDALPQACQIKVGTMPGQRAVVQNADGRVLSPTAASVSSLARLALLAAALLAPTLAVSAFFLSISLAC